MPEGERDATGPFVSLTYLLDGKYTFCLEFNHFAHKAAEGDPSVDPISGLFILFQWNIHEPAEDDFSPYLNTGIGFLSSNKADLSQPFGLKLSGGLMYFFTYELGLGAGCGVYIYGLNLKQVSLNIGLSLQLKL